MGFNNANRSISAFMVLKHKLYMYILIIRVIESYMLTMVHLS